jgi:thiol-disulfide isomerase/thioredoxin
VFAVSVLVGAQSGKKRAPQLTTDDVIKQKGGPPPNVPIDQPGEEPRAATSNGGVRGPVSPTWYSGADGYAQAERQHKQSNAPMAVYFYTDWCPYCKRLEANILKSDEVDRFLRNVVKVRVNPEDGEDETLLARRYGITGYPSFFIVPAGATSPKKITPYKRQGSGWAAMGPADFVQACQEAAEK